MLQMEEDEAVPETAPAATEQVRSCVYRSFLSYLRQAENGVSETSGRDSQAEPSMPVDGVPADASPAEEGQVAADGAMTDEPGPVQAE